MPCIQVCLKGGADINHVSEADWSPLEMAMVTRKKETVEFLLAHGAVLRFTEAEIEDRNTTDEIKELFRAYYRKQPKQR